MSTQPVDPRTVAMDFVQSDIFQAAVVEAIQQSLVATTEKLSAVVEDLTPMKEEILALKNTVRQLIEEKESSVFPTGTAAPAPTVTVTDAAPAAANPPVTAPAAATAIAMPPPPPPASRQQIPHPEPFDGKQRALFLPWKTAMLAKLRIEGAIIGDAQAQFFYVHNRLKGQALQMVTAYMEEMQRLGSMDPHHFISYLSTIYDDPNKKEKAMNELSALR